jgi:hypothetical protein
MRVVPARLAVALAWVADVRVRAPADGRPPRRVGSQTRSLNFLNRIPQLPTTVLRQIREPLGAKNGFELGRSGLTTISATPPVAHPIGDDKDRMPAVKARDRPRSRVTD